MPRPDVAIVGGGIVGLTTALHLARRGARVAVYDRGDFGKEASWAGAGIVPPGNPERAATPADALRAIGARQFPHFSAELKHLTGIENGYRPCGGVEFLAPEDADVPDLWAAEGIAFERLSPQQARALEPVGPTAGEAYLLPGMAQVRNPWHLRAVLSACALAGVELHANTGAESWELSKGSAAALRLANGDRVEAGRFLVAAGAWSERLLKPLNSAPRVFPVLGQIAALRGPGPSRVLLFGKRYMVPRGDGLTLIGSTEEPEAGFEKRTTEAGIGELIAFARTAVPVLKSAALEASWAGLRPGSPDGLPFLGAVPGWSNVYVAAGHFRAGVQLSIGTAQVMCELLTDRPTCVPLASFALDRVPTTGKSAFRS
jgi:glycine oxidase